VFLDPADHSTVVMVNRFKETENAKAFTQTLELQEAMLKAGVNKAPEVLFFSKNPRNSTNSNRIFSPH
jgi:hypothetical protein